MTDGLELSKYHCNPWHELEVSTYILKNFILKDASSKKVVKGFDPNTINESYSFNSTAQDEVFQSFSFLRMFEEVGLPMRCGMVNMFPDEVANSARWIEPYAPFWALSALIRTGKSNNIEEIIKEWFTRVDIANFSEGEIENFYNLLLPAFKQVIKNQDGTLNINNFLNGSLPGIIEIISRICFRLTSTQLNEIFHLAIETYKNPGYMLSLNKYIKNLFKRIFLAMSNENLINKLSDLLNLPIPQVDGFDVADTNSFVEPFHYINFLYDFNLNNGYDRSSWNIAITKLLEIAVAKSSVARKRAITRLRGLYNIEALTEEEREKFKKVIWARTDNKSKLPKDVYFYKWVSLILPGAEENNAKEKLRSWLLETEIPLVYNINDKKGLTYSGKNMFDMYINNLIYSTDKYYIFSNNKEEYIEWTIEEIDMLLDKIIDWWEQEKSALLPNSKINLFIDYKSCVKDLISLLGIFMVNVDSDNDEVKNKIFKLIDDFKEANFNILEILPMTLFIKRSESDRIMRKLRKGLYSMNEDKVQSTILGIYYWTYYGELFSIPSIPQCLLENLINKIYIRRRPKLNKAIEYITTIVEKMPNVLSKEQKMLLYDALEYLKEETDIKQLKTKKMVLPFPNEYITDYRSITAKLAYQLYQTFDGQNMPSILLEWKEICKNSLLPEVRTAWNE